MPKFECGYKINGEQKKKTIRAIDEGSANMKFNQFLAKESRKKDTISIKKGFMYEIC